MNDDSPSVLTEVIGTVALVRFNRPRERNPLSVATLEALRQTTSELFSRTDIHALIFTGTDDVFASGANIRELAKLDTEAALRFSKLGQEFFQSVADNEKLTIAAINGYCMGGALDFALACDLRVASTTATFAHPGARLGIITGWSGTQRLPRIIGRARALELFVTGRSIGSAEALSIGLVSKVKDPILACALEISQTFQSRSTISR